MKIKDLPKFELLKQVFGETRPAVYLEWLQLLGIITENSEKEASNQDHAALIYFLSTCECKSDIQNKISNGLPSEVLFLSNRLTFFKTSHQEIFNLMNIKLSKGRIEFCYPGVVNYLGSKHIGTVLILPATYVLNYWEALNL